MVIAFRAGVQLEHFFQILFFQCCFSSWFSWFVVTHIIVLSTKHSMTFSFSEYVKVRKDLIAWKVKC